MWKHLNLILGVQFLQSGLFVILLAVLLGSSDFQRLQMVVLVNEAEWRATNEKKEVVELPFVIELKSFTIDEYDNGKPKCFTSEVAAYTPNGEVKEALIQVNKPLTIGSWKIYQSNYDKTLGKWSRYTVFDLIKDPWLPAVYVGICMMLAGAVFLFFSAFTFKIPHYRKSVILILVGIILFSFFIARMWLSPERTNSLAPALQSPWFVPHVVAYMLAYSVFSVAVILALYLLIRPNKREKQMPLCDSLVNMGTAFLTMGMLIGAIWAKEVWGDCWTWDPKETWAAATWLGCLFFIHFRLYRPDKTKTAIYLLFFAFLLLQICWVGVKYFPVLQGNSVHVYQ